MNGRIYDPLLGRFLSADVLVDGVVTVQGFNRYSYTKNNPMSRTDPSGYMAPAIPLILIGGELAVEGALGTAAALLMVHHLITEKPPEGGPWTNSTTGTAPPMGGGGTDVLDPPQTSPEVLDTNDFEPRPLNGVENPQGSPDPEGDPETEPMPVAPLIGSDSPNDDGERYLADTGMFTTSDGRRPEANAFVANPENNILVTNVTRQEVMQGEPAAADIALLNGSNVTTIPSASPEDIIQQFGGDSEVLSKNFGKEDLALVETARDTGSTIVTTNKRLLTQVGNHRNQDFKDYYKDVKIIPFPTHPKKE